MIRRARHRLQVVLVVIGCLLFQQVAVAAYACDLSGRGSAPPAAMEGCAGMKMAPTATASPALCEKHCAPDLSVLTDAALPAVPALALPSAFAIVLDAPAVQVARYQEVPISRSDPPPRLRYCSLLI